MIANVNITSTHDVTNMVEHRSRIDVITQSSVYRALAFIELILQIIGSFVPYLKLCAWLIGILRLTRQIFDVQEKFLQNFQFYC